MTRRNGQRMDPRWLAVRDRLGVEPDVVIAREMGVSRQRVHAVRVRLGIAMVKKSEKKGA